MPALQVRDFPDDLYEELKRYAQRNHRSIAQQTVVAVEQMLRGERSAADAVFLESQNTFGVRRCRYSDFDTEKQRIARIEKRKDLFAHIDASKGVLPSDFPDPIALIREGRAERGEALEELIPATEKEEGPA